MNSNMGWDEMFMRAVYLVAAKSKDPRTKIGAVLVSERRIVATGYNGLPRKVDDKLERYERPEKYLWITHGEANCIHDCAYRGVSSRGTTLYTQGLPCADCAKTLIQGGIRDIIIHAQWPKMTHSQQWIESTKRSRQMFQEAGIWVGTFDQVLDVKGLIDGREVSV